MPVKSNQSLVDLIASSRTKADLNWDKSVPTPGVDLQGEFLHNMLQNQKSIVNSMAVNEDGVLASGADNGSLW